MAQTTLVIDQHEDNQDKATVHVKMAEAPGVARSLGQHFVQKLLNNDKITLTREDAKPEVVEKVVERVVVKYKNVPVAEKVAAPKPVKTEEPKKKRTGFLKATKK